MTQQQEQEIVIVENKKPKKERKQRDTREEKAKKMLYEGKVTRVVHPEEIYKVESENTPETHYKVYVRNLSIEACTCKDYDTWCKKNRDHKCKHMRLVELAIEQSFVKTELAPVELSYKVEKYDF